MAEKKTLEERYADEVLTDNAALNHYFQCRDCIFRDRRALDGEEHGYKTCVCRIYGKITAMRTNETYPDHYSYTPIEPGDKPPDIYDNTGQCEYYEKEKQK